MERKDGDGIDRLMKALEKFIATHQIQLEQNITLATNDYSLGELLKLNLPTFSSLISDLHVFIDEMKKRRRILRCDKERLVELASFQLIGEAGVWF